MNGSAMNIEADAAAPMHRVRVWFGAHAIADYRAEPVSAERYAAAMARRFYGLKVTNEPLPARPESDAALVRPLPSERLWSLPPH